MHVCTYLPVQSMYLCVFNAPIPYMYIERDDKSFALQWINYIIHKLSQLVLHFLVEVRTVIFEKSEEQNQETIVWLFGGLFPSHTALEQDVSVRGRSHTSHHDVWSWISPFFPVCTSESLGLAYICTVKTNA